MGRRLALAAGLGILPSLAVGLLVGASPVAAQPRTGSLTFVVTDVDGEPLAGVAVSLACPKLQGSRLRETNGAGRAYFGFLPPGEYAVEFDAPGHSGAGRTVVLDLASSLVERVTLASREMTETVAVHGQAPLDATDSGIRYTFDAETLQNLQLGKGGRNYQAVLQQVPGVGGVTNNPSVHGATSGENRYLVDGVDTTDPATGTRGMNLGIDSIEAVEFMTGGFRAESGQATGGLVNVVTRSGGNEWSGSFDIRYDDDGLVESSHLTLPSGAPAFDEGVSSEFRNLGVTLGGPILRDKLWFFLAYSDIHDESRRSGATAARTFDSDRLLGKLTFQPNQDHRLALQYTSDPAVIGNTNAGTGVSPEAHGRQDQGSELFSATWWGRLGEAWEVSAQAGVFDLQIDAVPMNDTGEPSRVNLVNGWLSGNFDRARFNDRERSQLAANATYRTSGRSWHEWKFGADFQDTSFGFRESQPGGAKEYVLGLDTAQDPYGRLEDPIRVDRLVPAPPSSDDAEVLSLFVQDTWHAGERFVLDYGLRWDRTRMTNDVGTQVADFDLLQPRVGGAIDLDGSRKNVLSFHFGRFMDPGLLSFARAANENFAQLSIGLNEAANGVDCNGDGVLEDLIVEGCFSFGGSGSRTDALRAMHVDEATVGYRRALGDTMSFGARYVWRRTDRIIEDVEDPPGSGLYLITNVEGLVRRYQGFELDFALEGKRWHVWANYTLSWSKGNVDSLSLRSDFDLDPEHHVNRYGYLSADRRHVLKVHGWVDLPARFQVAWDLEHASGLPHERWDRRTPPYGAIFLDPRGSHRLPSLTRLDAEVRRAWSLGGGTRLSLIGSVENLLKDNEVTAVNENDGSQWGSPTAFQPPRSYRLGLRLTW